MITEKQKCIAEQAIYGDLKASYNEDDKRIYKIGVDKSEIDRLRNMYTFYLIRFNDALSTKSVKPILRPMSDLTKEITHKGYNDDKPFIPIDGILSDESLRSLWKRNRRSIECVGDYIFCTVKDIDGNVGKEFEIHIGLRLFDFLNQLHFDYRNLISKGDAISTDEVGDVYGVID
jgi:hypothetical protein